MLALTTLPDEFLISINTIEILGIIYLAVAISQLRAAIARIEGKDEQRARDNGK